MKIISIFAILTILLSQTLMAQMHELNSSKNNGKFQIKNMPMTVDLRVLENIYKRVHSNAFKVMESKVPADIFAKLTFNKLQFLIRDPADNISEMIIEYRSLDDENKKLYVNFSEINSGIASKNINFGGDLLGKTTIVLSSSDLKPEDQLNINILQDVLDSRKDFNKLAEDAVKHHTDRDPIKFNDLKLQIAQGEITTGTFGSGFRNDIKLTYLVKGSEKIVEYSPEVVEATKDEGLDLTKQANEISRIIQINIQNSSFEVTPMNSTRIIYKK